jgi:GNAT superfamily N-acetyltransferase
VIRKATSQDLDQIWGIYKDSALDVSKAGDPNYGAKVQKEGFVIETSDKEDLLRRIKTSRIFNVYIENGETLGFVDINKEIYFPKDADNIIWLKPKAEDEYFHGKETITLHLIAADKSHQNEGIAKMLLEDAETKLKKAGITQLFAITTTGPLTNCPSITWHTKMGFERVCITLPIDLFGLKNYTSLLFRKTI